MSSGHPCGGLRGDGVFLVLLVVPGDGGAHLLLGDEELHAVRLAQVRVERTNFVASPVAVCGTGFNVFRVFIKREFRKHSNIQLCNFSFRVVGVL